jgi:hypothetical protein
MTLSARARALRDELNTFIHHDELDDDTLPTIEQALRQEREDCAKVADTEALQQENQRLREQYTLQKEIADNQTWWVRRLREALDKAQALQEKGGT